MIMGDSYVSKGPLALNINTMRRILGKNCFRQTKVVTIKFQGKIRSGDFSPYQNLRGDYNKWGVMTFKTSRNLSLHLGNIKSQESYSDI